MLREASRYSGKIKENVGIENDNDEGQLQTKLITDEKDNFELHVLAAKSLANNVCNDESSEHVRLQKNLE